uniref:Secreted protein n=1 Tax=Rhipicephalus appendiculatus TaxID=34631 RepID=A0A131YEH8_RHIAP
MCFALLVIFMCSFARWTCVTKTNAVERRVALRLASQAVVTLSPREVLLTYLECLLVLILVYNLRKNCSSAHRIAARVLFACEMRSCCLDSARTVSTFSRLM